MNKTQNGFALVEGLLITLILVIIGFGGYYVWHAQKETDKTNTDTLKASQSTVSTDVITGTREKLADDKVEYNLPKGWTASVPNNTDCLGLIVSDTPPECLAYTGMAPTSLFNDPNNSFIVYFSVFSQGNKSSDPKSWINGMPSTSDKYNTLEALKVNGQNAYHYEQVNTYLEPYTDEKYAIVAHETAVSIYSRTTHQNDATGTNDNFTKYLPDIKAIVNSVKIN